MFTNPEAQDLVIALAHADDTTDIVARRSGLSVIVDGTRSQTPAELADSLPTAVAVAHDLEGQPLLFCGAKGGVLRSTDGGQQWQVHPLGTPAPVVTDLLPSPRLAHDHTLYAATLEDGVLRSTDGGQTWTIWNFGLLDWRVLTLAALDDRTLYAGTESGVYLSRTAGRSWTRLSLSATYGPVLSLATRDGLLLAGTQQHGLFRSTDHGSTWETMGLADAPVNCVIAPAGAHLLVLAGTQLLMSADHGASWQTPPYPDRTDGVTAIDAPQGLSPGNLLLVGYQDGSLVRCRLP